MGYIGHVARIGGEKCMYNVDKETSKKRPLQRSRHRWDDIEMDPTETVSIHRHTKFNENSVQYSSPES